jgi:diadenosine tetraphosphate (Ap4A) HIT family hydrolase
MKKQKLLYLAIGIMLVILIFTTDLSIAQVNEQKSDLTQLCLLCRILLSPTLPESKIYETDHWMVVLHISDQRYLGRCVVFLKRHCPDLSNLTEAEWIDFADLVKTLEPALKHSFGATMFNWSFLMNNAYRETPAKPHVHCHFRPRYKESVAFQGISFQDTQFGEHYDLTKKPVSPEVQKAIVKAVRQSIEELKGSNTINKSESEKSN